MEREEIADKIREIIRREKTIPEGEFDSSAALGAIGIDSLDALNILFAIEESFAITIPDDTARSIKTFDDLVSAVSAALPT